RVEAARAAANPPTETSTQSTKPLLPNFTLNLPPVDDHDLLPALRDKKLLIKSQPPSNSEPLLPIFLYLLVPILLFAGLWIMLRRTRDQFLGGGILSGFSKSPA